MVTVGRCAPFGRSTWGRGFSGRAVFFLLRKCHGVARGSAALGYGSGVRCGVGASWCVKGSRGRRPRHGCRRRSRPPHRGGRGGNKAASGLRRVQPPTITDVLLAERTARAECEARPGRNRTLGLSAGGKRRNPVRLGLLWGRAVTRREGRNAEPAQAGEELPRGGVSTVPGQKPQPRRPEARPAADRGCNVPSQRNRSGRG